MLPRFADVVSANEPEDLSRLRQAQTKRKKGVFLDDLRTREEFLRLCMTQGTPAWR